MKKIWFHILHFLTGVVAKAIADIHMPWARKKLSYKDVEEMEDYLEPGDIILTRTNGEFTTFAIPGYWKHAAIYMGGQIADATRSGVHERYLADLVMKADEVAILRVANITEAEQIQMVTYAVSHFGKEYDFEMWANNSDALFCSEYAMVCVNKIRPNYLEFRKRSGLDTFTPQDIYDANKKFVLIWEKKSS